MHLHSAPVQLLDVPHQRRAVPLLSHALPVQPHALSVQLQALPMQPQAVPTRPHTLPTTCEAQTSKRRMPHSRATCATSKPETVTLLRREAATTTIRGEQARSDEEHRCRLRNRRLLLNVRRAPDLERDVRVAEMAVGVE